MIAEFAQTILDEAAASLEAQSIEVPERRYRHVGSVTYDCPQFVIALLGIPTGVSGGDPSPIIVGCNGVHHFQGALHLVNCAAVPKGNALKPTEEDLDTIGSQRMIDAHALVIATIFALNQIGACKTATFDGITISSALGGFVGLISTFTFDLI